MNDSEPMPRGLKLAAYNLHNHGREDNPDGVYEQKIEFLSDIIRQLDADLIAVAEIREEAAFHDLVQAVGYYPEAYLGDLTPDRRQLRVGILTRLPVLERGQWYEFPAALPGNGSRLACLRFRRAVPWLRVRLPDGSTMLAAAVHLKSGRPEIENVPETESPRRREVLGLALSTAGRTYEAAGLRCRLDDAMACGDTDHYAVLGDFNDGPRSEQVRLVQGRIAAVIETAASVTGELFAIADLLPAEQRVSYIGWGQREQLDHILVSNGLYTRLHAAGIETHLIDGNPPRQVGMKNGYPRSDHAPIWAEFDCDTGKDETPGQEVLG